MREQCWAQRGGKKPGPGPHGGDRGAHPAPPQPSPFPGAAPTGLGPPPGPISSLSSLSFLLLTPRGRAAAVPAPLGPSFPGAVRSRPGAAAAPPPRPRLSRGERAALCSCGAGAALRGAPRLPLGLAAAARRHPGSATMFRRILQRVRQRDPPRWRQGRRALPWRGGEVPLPGAGRARGWAPRRGAGATGPSRPVLRRRGGVRPVAAAAAVCACLQPPSRTPRRTA